MAPSTTKPAMVIIPGSFHQPSHYVNLHNSLQDAGYDVTTVALPFNGPPEPTIDMSQDVAAVQAVIQSYIDQDKNAMLVMHSMGGFVGSCAAQGLRPQDQPNGKGIISLVYLCVFVPAVGQAPLTASNGQHAPWVKRHGPDANTEPNPLKPEYSVFLSCTNPAEAFYHDCTPEVQADAVSKLQLFSEGPCWSPCTYAAWKEIESNYLICELDRAIPVFLQEAMVAQEGQWKRVERIQSSHSPFLSRLEDTVRFVRMCAGEVL